MDDDVTKWIKESEGKQYTDVFSEITSKIYDLLEYKKSRSDKVTGPLINAIRKSLEFLQRGATDVSTENKVMRARLEDRTEYAQMMQDLAQKISKPSVSSVDDGFIKPMKEVPKRNEEFTVVITPKSESQNLTEVKEKIKTLCKTDRNLPVPMDVVVTKARQVILKYRNKQDVGVIRDKILESEEIKDEVKVNVPVMKRERVLILSVDSKIKEEEVKKEVIAQLGDSEVGEFYKGMSERLKKTDMEETTRLLLENIIQKQEKEIKIIRGIPTKQGKINWLLDVDKDSKKLLLAKRRICLDYERYRVVEFVPIVRCYKCQAYGHRSDNCENDLHCVKCADAHYFKDCKNDVIQCANCYFEDASGKCDHRADSPDCPIFQQYRNKLIPSRS